MFYKTKIFLLVALFFTVISSSAQNVSKIDVDELSDAKIASYVQNVKAKGYTVEQAITIAKTRGMSELQAQKLLARIRNLGVNETARADKKATVKTSKSGNSLFGLTGKESKSYKGESLFGYGFFNNPKISFTPSVNTATPDNYIIGPGDVISIDLWGAAETNYEKRVGKKGTISISGVGFISVQGLPVKAATSKIKNYLKRIYSGITAPESSYNKVHVAVSIKQVRNVQINITGEVKVPGTYSLNGFSTVLNSLYACGGPTQKGTLRDIRLFRGGKLVSSFDFYDFLINGSEKGNITIQDQDVIIVKPYNKLAVIEGAVKRPGIYEMKSNETFSDLLKFCSGFNSNAYRDKIIVKRINGLQKEIVEISPSQFSTEKLQSGDYMIVSKVLDEVSNQVSITGAVYQPGIYQYKEGLTLAELLKKAEGYTKNAFLDRGIIVRTYDNTNKETISFSLREKNLNLLLKVSDKVYIYSKNELKEKEYITINGAVNKPGKFEFMKDMKVEDLIVLAGGLKDGADATVIDVSRVLKDGSFETISKNFDVKAKENLQGSFYNDFSLEPFDVISVRYLKGYTKQKTVVIQGEVNYSGTYSLSNKNERISDLINQAGGLTKFAYIKGAYLLRKNKKNIPVKNQIALIDGLSSTLGPVSSNNIKGKSYFKLSVNLEKILTSKKAKYDLILEEGDKLIIPSEEQTVKIEGNVMVPSLVRYEKGKSLKHYVQSSGGFSSRAKRNKTYVVHTNGDIESTKSFLFFRSYPSVKPGSIILVPNKPERKKSSISTQEIVAITTGLATLGLLVRSLTPSSNSTK